MKFPTKPFKIFTLQWFITKKCELQCPHCYRGVFPGEEMKLKEFKIALKNYLNFLKYFNLKEGRITFIGGDPLLHKNFWEILKLSRKFSLGVAVAGNPHLLNYKTVKKLKKFQIRFYQMSLEGLKKTNGYFRGKDNFEKVINAIHLLEAMGIPTVINMTISKRNRKEVIPLIKFLSQTPLSYFDFVRIVPLGRGQKYKKDLLSPLSFRNLLIEILQTEKEIQVYNKKLKIGKKDHLWKLLYFELGKLRINLNRLEYGCGMAYRHFSIFPTGDIYLCSKIPIKVGNLLEKDLITIFKTSPIIKLILKNELISACRKCKLKYVCRGCPAIAYNIYKDFKHRDPQCWKT